MKLFFKISFFLSMGIIFIFSGCSTDDGLDEKDEGSYGKDNCFCDGSFIFKWPENLLDWPEELDWAVKLKLKTGLYDNNILSEELEIKSLLLKYDVTISPSWWIPNSPSELYLYFDVKGKGIMSVESRENVINDLLKTKKFESDVYIYEITHLDDSYLFYY